MSRKPVLMGVGVLCTAAAMLLPSAALAAPPARVKHVEVVLTLKDKQAKKLSGSFEQALFAAAKKLPTVELAPARQQLSKFTACGANLACISELGHKSGADAVLLGRWIAAGKNGFNLQYILVNTQTKRIDKSDILSVSPRTDVSKLIAANVEAMLQPPPPAAAPPAATPPSLASAPAPAAPPADEMPPPPAPPREVPSVKPQAPTAAMDPPVHKTERAALPPVAQELPPTAPLGAARTLVWPPHGNDLALWGGVSAAAAGVVVMGIGGYYGAHALQLRGSIVDSTSQIKAASLGAQANSEAQRANVLFVVGGVVTAAGALFGLSDLLGFWDTHGTATVAFGPHGTALGLITLH